MKFYVPDHGETALDGYEITPDIDTAPRHDKHTAEAVAIHGHSGNHSWWECSWPMVIVLVGDDGKESTWGVDREMVPEFWAHEVKKP